MRTDIGTGLFRWREDIPVFILFLCLVLLFLHNALYPLSSSEVLGSRHGDALEYLYPSRASGFSILRQGIIPFWSPYIYSGTPYVGTLQTGIFYPLNCLFLILPADMAINWTFALHQLMSCIFTYFLLRHYNAGRAGSVLAGIIYTFSASQIMHIYAGHLSIFSTMTWTPLMLLFFDRLMWRGGAGNGAVFALTIAAAFLAGNPQYLFYSLIALFLYMPFVAWQIRKENPVRSLLKNIISAGAFAAVGFALSAIQFLPTVELTGHSTRSDLTYEWISLFSFPPENLVTFIIPDFFGNDLGTAYWGRNLLWEMSAYVGLLPLFLAAGGYVFIRNRTRGYFTFLMILSVILALGKHTPLLNFLYSFVPGFHLFRGSSKFVFLNALSVSVLSGLALDGLAHASKERDPRYKRIMSAGVIVTGILVIIISAVPFFYDTSAIGSAVDHLRRSGETFEYSTQIVESEFPSLALNTLKESSLRSVIFLCLGGMIFILYRYTGIKGTFMNILLIGLVAADLFSFGMRYMITFNSSETMLDRDVTNFLRLEKEPFRIIAPDVLPNTGMASGIEMLSGYETIMLKDYNRFINLSQGLSPDDKKLFLNISKMNGMTDLLNARYIIESADSRLDENPVFKLVFKNEHHRVYRNMNAMPRAFIVHKARVSSDRSAVLQEIASPLFNAKDYAIVEEPLDIKLSGNDELGPLPVFLNRSPNHITISADLNEPGLLVLSEVYYPGWKAYVDGKEQKIYRTDYLLRGVALPLGSHVVEFRYDPSSFRTGSIISIITLLCIVSIFITY